MKRRTLLACLPWATSAAIAARPIVAAPYITPSQMVQGLLQHQLLPGSKALLQTAQALAQSLAQPGAAWTQHRALWTQTMLAWETLAAVAVGPLLERRSAREIDFWPTRPAQIQRLLINGLGAVQTVQQLDSVGASARGLPALEWLLWKTDGSGHALAYARLLAQQIEAEAALLLSGYQNLANTEREDSDAWTLYGEWFGQGVGGMDQLRIKKMVRDTRGKESSPWVRGVSGNTAACWQAQARGLQAFLVGSPTAQAATEAATPGEPVPGSLNSLLLGRGLMNDSRSLLTRTATMLRAVQAARPNHAPSIQRAQTALAQLSAQASALAGGPLQITLGFTDADGD